MKMKTVFPLFAAGLMALAGCNNKTQEVAPQGTPAINLANLDSTTTAGADFYQYACGGWMKAHPLTAEYSRFGTIDMVFENNNKQLKELVEGLALPLAKIYFPQVGDGAERRVSIDDL